MACPDRLSQWKQEVSTALPHLSQTQCWGLVCWSAGMVLSELRERLVLEMICEV
jgi:hypothetical protein